MAYSMEEQETVAVYDRIDDQWDVYSCVLKHINKLTSIKAPYWIEESDGKITAAKWKLNGKQVKFAMERVVSEEEKAKRAERLNAYRSGIK